MEQKVYIVQYKNDYIDIDGSKSEKEFVGAFDTYDKAIKAIGSDYVDVSKNLYRNIYDKDQWMLIEEKVINKIY